MVSEVEDQFKREESQEQLTNQQLLINQEKEKVIIKNIAEERLRWERPLPPFPQRLRKSKLEHQF